MAVWRSQRYRQEGNQKGVDRATLEHAVAIGKAIIDVHPELPPIFTLRHLAYLSNVDYGLLRRIVSREEPDAYRVFTIGKAPTRKQIRPRYRTICAPEPGLLRVQRWLARRVLAFGRLHQASVAYAKGCSIYNAAAPHCGALWLLKLDIRNFFESISEVAVYRAFRDLGYQALPAFEMARVCTRVGYNSRRKQERRWQSRHPMKYSISSYRFPRLGHLPQGAPTSPMLSNLVASRLDDSLAEIADQYSMVYTRYADDLTFSTKNRAFNRAVASEVIGTIYEALARWGFSPNASKSSLASPGARRIVLGLLVDGDRPKLTREFKSRIRQHLHYLKHPAIGPVIHARKRGFASLAGLKNHVVGLIAFAKQIDGAYGARLEQEFAKVVWPI